MQLTLVGGLPSHVGLLGEDGVGVLPGLGVGLLLVGDDGVELGGIELVKGACRVGHRSMVGATRASQAGVAGWADGCAGEPGARRAGWQLPAMQVGGRAGG